MRILIVLAVLSLTGCASGPSAYDLAYDDCMQHKTLTQRLTNTLPTPAGCVVIAECSAPALERERHGYRATAAAGGYPTTYITTVDHSGNSVTTAW